MRLSALVAATVTLGITLPWSASARECRGVSFPDQQEVEGTSLELNGTGVREATFLGVDAYVAALYVEETSDDGARLAAADMKKRLILHLVRDISRKRIVDAFRESMRKNNPNSHDEFDAQSERLHGWMQDAESGERVIFDYTPGTGIEVEFAGQTKGTVEGDEFAEAFFRIWLGPKPPNAGLKTGLLGGECG